MILIMVTTRVLLIAVAAVAAACGQTTPENAQPAATPAAAKPAFGSFGVDLSARKESVKPGDDFFAYANGTWLASTPIPPVLFAPRTAPFLGPRSK